MPSRRREDIQPLTANPRLRAGRPRAGVVRAGFLVGVSGTGWGRKGMAVAGAQRGKT